jgi:peptidoglycan/xylan/chitin deacetylase (PgdA/CDA1 family)
MHPPPLRRTLVLGYHAISARWPCTLAVSPQALEQQLGRLVRRGYRGVTLADMVRERHDGPVVVVTFDDAYRSVLELAFPILERLGLPGTVFAPTDHMHGRPMSWPGIDGWLATEHRAELTGCTWDELAVLAGAGWEVGSHTCTHPRLPTLADAALADELQRSRQECEQRLGTPCRTLAYPYGDSDARVAAAAAAAGYVATVGGRRSPGGPPHLLRADIYRKDDPWRVALKTSVLHGGLTRLAQVRDRPAAR